MNIEDLWNYDMSEAPIGYLEDVTRLVGKKKAKATVTVHRTVQILTCSKDGETVTTSRWVPKPPKEGEKLSLEEGRWNMYGTTETPLAWMPWPKNPNNKET